ncbi:MULTISPECIES: hypothetical protein [Candidatus Ichthyocystis]|uniref:Putative membrane protein n=1 Tax=Candidatus Ichthyocystis hellenicum TaxID=1561003 RepID=A0A0S4M276_9BURK|nr:MULTISPECIES: hypothetical protein [Ichthyocystis]CUT17119.1 putative membrane protein [Candidatus Ichthyocystis hellenicum]
MINARSTYDSNVSMNLDQESSSSETETTTEESLMISIDDDGYYYALPLLDCNQSYSSRLVFAENATSSANRKSDIPLSMLGKKLLREFMKVALPSFILGAGMFTIISGVHLMSSAGIYISIALCSLLGVAFVLLAIARSHRTNENPV